MSEERNVAPPTLMPPYRVYRGFLDSDMHAGMLAWAIENEAMFEPTKVGDDDGKPDPSWRISLRVRDFGPMKAMLRQRVLDLVPALIRDLRVTPFEPSKVTLELVAHNDGAFFKRHIDTFVGDARRASNRVLSAVYYFRAEPKAFSGGALRLYPFGAREDESNFIDMEPEQNMLLAFPSWAPHEVLPVSCPTGRFSDSRFAVNFWVHRLSKRIASDA
jgi:SM-20-related protein